MHHSSGKQEQRGGTDPPQLSQELSRVPHEHQRFAQRLVQSSYELPANKPAHMGNIPYGLDLRRGAIIDEYLCSDGSRLGKELLIPGARCGISATLEVVKLQSGGICHNIAIQLATPTKGDTPPKASPQVRSISLYFPSQAVDDQIARLTAWKGDLISGTLADGAATHFDALQLCDSAGRLLIKNPFNVVESSAERLRTALSFAQRPNRLLISCEKIGAETARVSIDTEVPGAHSKISSRQATLYLTGNRLLSMGEYQALQEVYSQVSAIMSLGDFQKFHSDQFFAWLWRKYLEPGGSSHVATADLELVRQHGLERLFHFANGLDGQDEKTFIFTSKLACNIIAYLGQLGVPRLELMREAGQKLFVCGAYLDHGEFNATHIRDGIPCYGSKAVKLSPQLLCTIGNLHHEAWMDARDWVNQLGIPELMLPVRREHKPYDVGHLSFDWVRDCGNGMGLVLMLGSWSEERFACLLKGAHEVGCELLPIRDDSIEWACGDLRAQHTSRK